MIRICFGFRVSDFRLVRVRLKLKGNHNPFQLSRNLARAEAFSEKIRIATQVSLKDEIEEQFQKEIVRSDYVSILLIIGNYLCQEIYTRYYNLTGLLPNNLKNVSFAPFAGCGT